MLQDPYSQNNIFKNYLDSNPLEVGDTYNPAAIGVDHVYINNAETIKAATDLDLIKAISDYLRHAPNAATSNFIIRQMVFLNKTVSEFFAITALLAALENFADGIIVFEQTGLNSEINNIRNWQDELTIKLIEILTSLDIRDIVVERKLGFIFSGIRSLKSKILLVDIILLHIDDIKMRLKLLILIADGLVDGMKQDKADQNGGDMDEFKFAERLKVILNNEVEN